MTKDENIVLIGMPGVGKSTLGVLLAKATGRRFVDTDLYIQASLDRPLQEILDAEGRGGFCRLEEDHLLCLELRRYVIATGGSVVYSDRAMQHLKSGGRVVHLDLALDEIEKRLTNFGSRGVVMARGQTLRSLYDQRQPLYRRWADLTVDCAGKTHEQIVDEIVARLADGAGR
jgi:shikimate kinase